MTRSRILIVEDNGILAIHLEETLTEMGYQAVGLVSSGQEAIKVALAEKPDLILMDIHLRGEMNGIEAVAEIHSQVNIPVVYLTAYTDEILLQQAKITDAYAYLIKPVQERELRSSLEMALYKHQVEKRLEHQNQVLRAIRNVNQIITHEHKVQPLLETVCSALVRTRGYQFVWVGQMRNNRSLPLASAGKGRDFLDLVLHSASQEQAETLPCAMAMRSRQAIVCSDTPHDPGYAPWRAAVEKEGFVSSAAIPLLYGGNQAGVLCIYSHASDLFDDEEVELLLEMAGDIAFALQKIEDEMARQLAEEALNKSEEKYRLLVENINEVIFLSDTNGVFTYISPVIRHIFQYTPSELVNQSISTFIHPDDQAAMRDKLPRILAGEAIPSEYRVLDKDGSIHHVRTSSRVIIYEGVVSGVITLMSDISAYKQLEAGLRASEERFRQVMDTAGEWIWEVDADGLYCYASPLVEQILGYRPEELVGKKHFYDLFAPAVRQTLKEAVLAGFERNEPIRHFVNDNITKDGRIVVLDTNGTPILDEQGRLIGYRGADSDITARTLAEEAVQSSEAHLKAIFNASGILLAMIDVEGRFIQVNQTFLRHLGYDLEELEHLAYLDLVHPGDVGLILKTMDTLLKGQKAAARREMRILHQNGSSIWVDMSVTSILDAGGKVNALVCAGFDISERKRAEEALQESEAHFRSIVDNSEAGYFFIDKEGFIRDVNPAWVKLYHYDSADEILGHHFAEIQQIDDLENAKEFVAGIMHGEDRFLSGEISRKCKDGSTGFHTFSARPVTREGQVTGIEGFIIDSTARKSAEQALIESEQKYRSLIESMTEGVALHSLIYDESGQPIDYRIEEINPAYEQQIGIEIEHARGAIASQLYGVSPAPYLEIYNQVAQSGKPAYFQTYFAPLQRYFNISVVSPRPGWFATIFTDITVRKNTEDALRVSNQRFESLFQYSPIPLLEIDFSELKPYLMALKAGDEAELVSHLRSHPDTLRQRVDKVKVIGINRAVLAFFNTPNNSEFLEQFPLIASAFLNPNSIRDLQLLMSEQRQMFNQEINLSLPGQEERWIQVVMTIDPQYSGTLERTLVSLNDLTARKHAEDVLRQAEARFRSLFENMSQGVFYIDGEGRILQTNPAAQKILGLKAKELLGRKPDDVRWQRIREDGSILPASDTATTRAIQSGKSVDMVYGCFNPKIQDYRWLDVSAVPQFRPGEARPYQTYVIFEDITGRREAEKEKENLLERTRQQAERLAAVLQISSSLRLAQVESEVLHILVEQSSEGLKAETILLGLIDENELVFSLATGEWTAFRGQKQAVDQRLKQLLLSGQPSTYHSRSEMRRARLPVALQPLLKSVESCMLIPFKVVDAPIGLLVAGYHTPMKESPDHLGLAAAIGEIAGITLQRMRLLDSLEKLAAERARDLAGLYNVISAASGSLDMDAVLKQVLEQVLKIVGAGDGAIFSIDPTQQWLKMMSVIGLEESRALISTLSLKSSVEGWVVEHSEPMLVANINQDARFHIPEKMREAHFAYMALPMRTRRVVKGVLIILRKDQPFNLEEITLIGSIADHIALIIDNLTLYQLYEQAAVLEERSRLARDLHDSATQSLYSVTLYAEASRATVEKGDLTLARQYLDRLTQTARLALQEMRLLVYELRPPSLEQDGLIIALRKRLESVEGRAGVEARMDLDNLVDLTPQQEEHIFWIAMETLNNSLRHAAATHVDIQLKTVDNEIVFSVKDDGRGFDFEKGRQSGGMGLQNIQQRAQQIGARLEINTVPGNGTAVTIYLPRADDPMRP